MQASTVRGHGHLTPSGSKSAYGNDGNSILTHIAQPGTDDHGERTRFSYLGCIDPLVSELEEISSRFVHLALAQLDFECSPPTIPCLYDCVDFESRVVLILPHLRV
jgi:hypothetical protein